MSRYWNDRNEYSQPDAAQLKRNSKSSIHTAKAKGKVLEPVVIQGRAIAKNWWGKAWCDNLERYADFSEVLRMIAMTTKVNFKINGRQVTVCPRE